jgi:hypothetical protein
VGRASDEDAFVLGEADRGFHGYAMRCLWIDARLGAHGRLSGLRFDDVWFHAGKTSSKVSWLSRALPSLSVS